jgi:hypothetical protein
MNCASGKTHGTCDALECPLHGRCHCGCGEEAKINKKSSAPWQRVRGMPAMFSQGHHPKTRASGFTGPDDPRRSVGAPHWHNVPIEKVRPLVLFLAAQYPSARQAAFAIGISESTMHTLKSSKQKKGVSPELARTISAAVLKHRRPADPFAEYEARRLPTPYEQALMRRERERIERKKFRDRAKATA